MESFQSPAGAEGLRTSSLPWLSPLPGGPENVFTKTPYAKRGVTHNHHPPPHPLVHIWKHTLSCVCVCVYVCMCVCMHACMHACMYTDTDTDTVMIYRYIHNIHYRIYRICHYIHSMSCSQTSATCWGFKTPSPPGEKPLGFYYQLMVYPLVN